MISANLQPLNSGERAITHLAGGWVGFGTRLDGMENLASTRIRSLDRPARIELLYRLHYPNVKLIVKTININYLLIKIITVSPPVLLLLSVGLPVANAPDVLQPCGLLYYP